MWTALYTSRCWVFFLTSKTTFAKFRKKLIRTIEYFTSTNASRRWRIFPAFSEPEQILFQASVVLSIYGQICCRGTKRWWREVMVTEASWITTSHRLKIYSTAPHLGKKQLEKRGKITPTGDTVTLSTLKLSANPATFNSVDKFWQLWL